jgi:hypothetical protein
MGGTAVMSPLVNRGTIIVVGLLLCLAAAGYLLLCIANHDSRHIYVRPVHYAVEQGKDPYLAARHGVDELAGVQLVLGRCFAVAVFLGGLSVAGLAARRGR